MIKRSFSRKVLVIIFFSFTLAPFRTLAALPSERAQERSQFASFRRQLADYGKIPLKDAKIMWQFGVKKVKREQIDSELQEKAKIAFKRTGLPVAVVLMIIGTVVYSVSMLKQAKVKSLTDELTLLSVEQESSDNLKKIENLLRQGADVNSKVPLFRNLILLHGAARHTTPKQFELLLAKARDVNMQDDEGKTALFYAVNYGNEPIVTLLLQKGANVNVQDKKGNTPLDVANGNYQYAIAKTLKAKGAKTGQQLKEEQLQK